MEGLNATQIMKLLPHSYPFLLIDTVDVYRKGSIICKKNVTINEPFFQGHFPTEPIMPGVLLVECGAQAAALMYILDGFPEKSINNSNFQDFLFDENLSGKVGYLASIKNFKLKNLVMPGNILSIRCKKLNTLGKLSEVEVKITNELHKEIASGRILVSQK
ncbi:MULTISPECIES: 3-hydroxyacyl-ACP dehydratase FabZ [Lactococcus]|jgi:3-hydroxyacyl-[acyl-carrier-protein] dehydratase|uniref:Beta-hydroxyacyl-ACP dehydratase n=2 Tax=Lactococcus TaxID=1357 RepID=A0A252CAY7_9LACT|nr:MULTISPECIES: 3-hydroxyacyl-ACP dehydratase FabZ [Lactococcus]OUK03751.1 beta-hydroxyacyl-ACP dehydratase [Lactococcus petauri]USI65614.1 3-hydroxyacyl-ACP dehydratase FabZ [Lactococcus petauri]USI68076.1 3-hydroxyacyl-ACP dehydratase FabZ [Lactococcus petauri]USJ20336.1 3-hydroxyacyl-ACP dehydratase FabZ [Lactococcus formosensis]WJE12736.1 3-hydroxyacyl-ACP dehydratase FabZ [Lactococcus petauri]